jgi:hypothetical protein
MKVKVVAKFACLLMNYLVHGDDVISFMDPIDLISQD